MDEMEVGTGLQSVQKFLMTLIINRKLKILTDHQVVGHHLELRIEMLKICTS